jgi:hypothetical protein
MLGSRHRRLNDFSMILFLDFDGVLHPYPPTRSAPLWCRSNLLIDWLDTRPDIEVVVSSTWRLTRGPQQIRELLPQRLANKFIGCTGLVHEELYARQLECEQWMKAHREPWVHWVALDDSIWNFRPFEKRLIICNRSTGIDESVIRVLDKTSR